MLQEGLTTLKFLAILAILAVLIVAGAFLVKKNIFKSQDFNSQVTPISSPKILLGTPCSKDADCESGEKCSASGSGTISAEGKQIPPIAFCWTK